MTILYILTIIVNMNIKMVTSTDLKLNTAEILNLVAYGGYEAIVKRHGEGIVKIVPFTSNTVKKDYANIVDKYFGADLDFPEVYKKRMTSKKNLTW